MKFAATPVLAISLIGSTVIAVVTAKHGFIMPFDTSVMNPVQPEAILSQNLTQVRAISRQVTVKINGQAPGSGVIIARQGQTYFVLTAEHVVATEDEYEVITPDGKQHRLDYKLVRKLPDNIDLAVVQFTSANTYLVVSIGRSAQLKENIPIYVAGFPHTGGGLAAYQFSPGMLAAVVTRPVGKGYTLAYDNNTFTGMSGGPILNEQGQLVGIHGASKTAYTESQGVNPASGSKDGVNLGIPVDSFLQQPPQVLVNLNLPVPPPVVIPRKMTASDFFILGIDRQIAGNSKAALGNYQKALQLRPNYASALLARANARSDLGDFRSAIIDYDQLLRLESNSLTAQHTLTAYHNRGVARTFSNDLEGAINDFDQVIRLNPNVILAYSHRGTARWKSNNLQGAMDDFNQAIRLNPNAAIAYGGRGNVRRSLGDPKGAISDFNKALRLMPNSAEVYYNRGLLQVHLGNHKGAITDFDQAIRLKPDFVAAYNNRGAARSQLGDLKGAIADYNQAIRLKPDFAEVYSNRGLTWTDLGDFKSAIADFNKALKLDSRHVNSYYSRGVARTDSGNPKGAIADFNQAIRLKPNFAAAYSSRGVVRAQLSDFKGAIADYDEALKINPSDASTANTYYNRGVSRQALGNLKGAISDLKRAANLAQSQGNNRLYETAIANLKRIQP
jgi:tetratricopeptide (TPR) repeat protein